MKIEKIEICNLASLEGTQVVDFTEEPLRSAGLFAITGNTGAGKSTLLDAICLALYNHAPRFDGTERLKRLGLEPDDDGQKELSAGDVRNILRRGQTEGYSKVTFSLSDGSAYEAGWSVRVKRTGTYDSVKRTLRRLSPQKEEYDASEVPERIVKLIRLSYEQFTRTVILAQNSFANFLNARQADKSLLLEKLTGTELYGNISRMVFEETGKARDRYKNKVEQIKGISTRRLDDETLAKTKEKLTLCLGQQTIHRAALERIGRQLKWYSDYHEAEAELEKQKKLLFEAQREYNSLYNQRQLLERFEKVQIFQGLYHTIKETESEIDKLKQQASQKQGELKKQKELTAAAQNEYETAHGRLEEATGAYRSKEPQFSQGHDLQGQINAIERELKDKREELKNLQETLRKQNEQLAAQEARREENNRERDNIYQHLQTIAMHRNLVTRVEYVKVALGQMNDLKKNLDKGQKQLEVLRQQLQGEKEQENKLNTTLTKLESEAKSLKEEFFIHTQANRGQSSVEIQKHIGRLSDTHRRAKGALDLWNRISNGYSEIEDKEDDIRRREIAVEQIKKEIEKQQIRVQTLADALEVLRTSYMLSQSENIIELRRSLKEGSACPVCGATHHPYHSETEQELGRILTTLESDFKSAEADTQKAGDELTELQQKLAEESGQLSQIKTELGHTKARQDSDVALWKDYESMDDALQGCSPSVNRENRKMLIAHLYDNSERELTAAQKALEAFNSHQEAINNINEKLREIDEKRSDDVRHLADVKANQRLLNTQISELQNTLSTTNDHLTEKAGQMDNIITIPFWKDRWLKGHDNFVQNLTILADDWNQSEEKDKQLRDYEFKIQEEVNTLLQWIDSGKHTRDELQGNISRKEQDVQHKQEELRHMFGNSTLEETVNRMKSDILKYTEEEDACRKAFDEATGKLQLLEGETANLEKQQHRREDDLRDLRSELDIRISRFNNDNSTLQYFELDKLFTDGRDWNALRQTINLSQQKLQQTTFNEETASKAILRLQQDPEHPGESTEESEIALHAQRDNHDRQLKEIEKALSESQALLTMHNKSVDDIAAQEPERLRLQKELNDWQKLNAIIGSADGKRFREIAQCYTFGILVGYANRHLRELTSRYRLQSKPGTLALEIIDRDMLDQTRAVNSLSGGETFIVSLALALGLSSMRSGNMHIGSLFIDEGFGNLDSESLDLVIDALSRLPHTQNRRVGIISHTAQIRSRISPQVRLIKRSGGKSRIEVR